MKDPMKRDRRKVMTFRLDDKPIAVIDRFASELSKKVGRKVTRSEAVRFILEGYGRAEMKQPEIGDVALLEKVASYPKS